MTALFAQLESVPESSLKNAVLILAGGLAAAYYAKEIFWSRPTPSLPQPLAVQVVEEMHKQFASKKEFDLHAAGNSARHGQLFAQIDRVERGARAEMDRRFNELNRQRAASLEKLNTEFIFIRENIAGINRELKIRNEEHS